MYLLFAAFDSLNWSDPCGLSSCCRVTRRIITIGSTLSTYFYSGTLPSQPQFSDFKTSGTLVWCVYTIYSPSTALSVVVAQGHNWVGGMSNFALVLLVLNVGLSYVCGGFRACEQRLLRTTLNTRTLFLMSWQRSRQSMAEGLGAPLWCSETLRPGKEQTGGMSWGQCHGKLMMLR